MDKSNKKDDIELANGNMFLSDTPVRKIKDDLLGREKFSNTVVEGILSWKNQDSLVVGLYGKWGSGKSTIINFIKEILNKKRKRGNAVIPKIIEFEPWVFSDKNNLIYSFLSELSKEFNKNDNENDKKIAKKLSLIKLYLQTINKLNNQIKKIVQVIIAFFGIPLISIISAISIGWAIFIFFIFVLMEILTFSEKIILPIEEFFNKKAELLEKTLNEIKGDLKDILSKRDEKVLIIIDDIDRLDAEEIKALFKLIKINLDLPNLIYLLALDPEVVGSLLDKDKVLGADYIEKIIQIPIYIPISDERKLSEFLFKNLDELIKFFPQKKWNKKRWGEVYHRGLSKIFLNKKTLRTIKRPVSAMFLKSSLICKEVNPVDFICIKTLEHFYPNLYYFIQSNKEIFAPRYLLSSRDDRIKQEVKEEIEKELNKYEPHIKDVLFELFPNIKSIFENFSFGDGYMDEWTKDFRVCSYFSFDAYFYDMSPENETANTEIDELINNKELSEIEKIFSENIKNNKIRNLLEKVVYFVDDIPKDNYKNLLIALFNISDNLPSEKNGMFDSGARMDVNRVVYQILKRLKSKEYVSQLLKDVVNNSKGLSGIVETISLQTPRKDDNRNDENYLIPDKDLKYFQDVCVERIKKSVNDGRLINNDNFLYIIYRWKEWGNENDIKKYVEQFKENDKSLISFVEKFIQENQSISMGDLISETKKEFSFKSLSDFLDKDYIKQKFNQLNKPTFWSQAKLI